MIRIILLLAFLAFAAAAFFSSEVHDRCRFARPSRNSTPSVDRKGPRAL